MENLAFKSIDQVLGTYCSFELISRHKSLMIGPRIGHHARYILWSSMWKKSSDELPQLMYYIPSVKIAFGTIRLECMILCSIKFLRITIAMCMCVQQVLFSTFLTAAHHTGIPLFLHQLPYRSQFLKSYKRTLPYISRNIQRIVNESIRFQLYDIYSFVLIPSQKSYLKMSLDHDPL